MNQGLASNTLDQELLTTGKRSAKTPSPAADSPSESKWSARLLLGFFYFSLALLSFLLFLLPKLPFQQITDSTLNFLSLQTPYVWKAKSTSLQFFWPPHLELQSLSLTSKPFGAGSGEAPQKIDFDKFTITPHIFSSIPIPGVKPFNPSAAFSFEAFQGAGSGHFSLANGSDFDIAFEGEKFNLEKLAPLLKASDLDLKGIVQNLVLGLTIVQGKVARSNGAINLTLKNLQLDPAGFNVGMPLPILSIGDVKLQGSIKNGRLSLDRTTLGGPNSDLEVFVDGGLNLKDPVDFSEIDLKLRIKLASKITTVLPYVESFLSTGKRPDGYYGLKLSGNLANPGLPQPYAGN